MPSQGSCAYSRTTRCPATFFVPGYTADHYPEAVERIAAAGHEIAHHGYSHHSPLRMDEAAERADLERALAALERVGVKPNGYRTPSWEPSRRTFDLLAEHGFSYDSSLMDDDKPYLLETASGTLVELPPHWSLDDWNQYAYMPDPRSGPGTVHPPSRAVRLWREELDGMRRHGCLFVLTMHPFLSGRPGRIEGLRTLIEHALECGDVEFLSCGEAARRAAGRRRAAAPAATPGRPRPGGLSRLNAAREGAAGRRAFERHAGPCREGSSGRPRRAPATSRRRGRS